MTPSPKESSELASGITPPTEPANASPPDNAAASTTKNAYLVLRSAGRWSDVFRLSPPGDAIIGRSSASQIVVRSEKASRRHARIHWSGDSWRIEDLGSRNGTIVDSATITGDAPLKDGSTIEIAGFSIQFVRTIEGAGTGKPVAGESSQATDDQLTMEMDPSAITDRRSRSQYLYGPPVTVSGSAASAQVVAHGKLLQLAFELARAEDVNEAIEIVLDRLTENLQISTAAAYLMHAPPSATKSAAADANDSPTLTATRQNGAKSYRRPPESLISSVSSDGGEAVLARNVMGDRSLATENSHGEVDAESLILAPVRDRDGVLRGLLHLTSDGGTPLLRPEDLEFVLAVAEILAELLSGLQIRTRLDRSLKQTKRQLRQLQEQLTDKVRIVGKSEPVQKVIESIALAAPTSATVLVRGESGVGKELVAAAIHHGSQRRGGPLVCMNCAALSPSLLESELFGHEKGAFTGATDRKQGKFEAADGGTLMLDEIGEMDAEIQAKFLRVLEGHPFERVGGHVPIQVDVRVVAATNRDLRAMVAEGTFRQDLYYRLHVVEIVVPPLRQRGQDILLLANHFLKQFNLQMGRKIESITPEAAKLLLSYSWPGNIRELKNVIERAVVLNTRNSIDVHDLVLLPAMSEGQTNVFPNQPEQIEITIAELERQHIDRVLQYTEGNKSRASSILGIERSTLDRKLKRYGESS
ncbi:sigma 54-interacting transcriptional regulator [Stieleria varia]|uniref:Transcriptional regulatory protein ZraR n=1 Tax=Stieleria varia TaxID=2528005 RepID=A0A5C6A385_9BACT|nr:sigma 54-interacting transcriptional regulator [Stieleria varia]TWT93866.1 Transcriptional regulatory protein ZraR [Stieleria varia]